MTKKEIEELNEEFNHLVTDWIQDYKEDADETAKKALKEKILEKTKVIAEYRKDNSLVERIRQRFGS